MHASKRDREVDDEQELVALCEGRFSGLKAAFALSGGGSMVAKDLRSYTEATLKELVEKEKGDWKLVPPWLDVTNLRPLLRDYQSPAVVKKSKVAMELPHNVDERARLLLAAVKEIQGTPEKNKAWSENMADTWPLLDREQAKTDIEVAVRNNLQRFREKDPQKRHWMAAVLTAAAGAGKSRLMREAPRWISGAIGQDVCRVVNVNMTFVNGYQLESADMIDEADKTLSSSIAIGLRVAARLFPQLGVCPAFSLNSFRRGLADHLRLCEVRTVMRAASLALGVTEKPLWVTLLMDEVHDAEHPKNVGCDGLWEGIVNAILNYMIPGEDTSPCWEDQINLFPIMASTWTSFRRHHLSRVQKVPLPLPALSPASTEQICELVAASNPTIRPVVENERFKAFLISCALVPDGLRIGLEATSELVEGQTVGSDLFAVIAKEIGGRFRKLYEIDSVPSDVLEFAMSGVLIPDIQSTLANHPFSHWFEKGFCSGDTNGPLAVPFPTLENHVGKIVPELVKFVNWGQPFYWQDFEALVPHIIRLRCSSLYRVNPNHCATLKEIFGSGPSTIVSLRVDMSVAICTEQWLVKKSTSIKNPAQQLKIKSLDKEISVSATRTLMFGSQSHVFAAADGNVHFDGHKRFQTEDGRSVVVFYQVKHTRIHPDKNVAHFDWTDINKWLVLARTFTKTFQCDVKLFLIVTNKAVHGIPVSVDDDLVLIHQGNLETFFAPCFVSSAHLATNKN